MNQELSNQQQLKAIQHWGYHFGREARSVYEGVVPEYPEPADWYLLRERFGEALASSQKMAFVQGYRKGGTGCECSFCHRSELDGMEAHARFLALVIR